MIPHFEVPSGPIDGVNTTFIISMAYTPGSTAVFLNGQLKRPDYADGWTETDPTLGIITLDIAPELLDVVQVFYIDTNTTPLLVVEEVSDLEAEIEDVVALCGTLADDDQLIGGVEDTGDVDGIMDDVDLLCGTIEDVTEIEATIEEIAP